MFSKIDLWSGYYQLKIRALDVPELSLSMSHGHYKLLIMSFGMTKAQTTFMELMNKVFRSYHNAFFTMFIVDILVYFINEAKHVRHQRIIHQNLRDEQLYAKLSKFDFWLDSISFLGYVDNKDGIMVDLMKVHVVRDWAILTCLIEIRSLVVLADYYRLFVQEFSYITTSLTKLTQKMFFFSGLMIVKGAFRSTGSYLLQLLA